MKANASWSPATRALHWILGIAIIGMIAYGYWMNHWAPRPDRFFYRSIHADVGYLILLLMAIRLIWRGFSPSPGLPPDTPGWQRVAAHLSHGALYVLTFAVTLLGWAHSGAHKPDYTDWFGLFRVPQFTSEDRAAAHLYEDWHIWMAYTLLAVVVLHVAAALYHHAVKRDRILMRMVDGKPLVPPIR